MNGSDKKEYMEIQVSKEPGSGAQDGQQPAGKKSTHFACPQSVHWEGEMPEIQIKEPIMNVLSMDGKWRWMDIEKLVSILLYHLGKCVCELFLR